MGRRPRDGEEPDAALLARERADLLAWIRTSIALIAGGLATSQLLQGLPGARWALADPARGARRRHGGREPRALPRDPARDAPRRAAAALAAAHDPLGRRDGSSASAPSSSSSSTRCETRARLQILVVDDDAPLRDMLARSFTREGHTVTVAADGQEALEATASAGVRHRPARRRARPGPRRPRRRARAARPAQRRADHHAHRAGQRGRHRPGPRGGRRRLRHQAVRPRGAAQPDQGRHAPRARSRRRRSASAEWATSS